MLLADWYIAKCRNGFAAYTTMQASLLARFIRRGGSVDEWVERLAPAYRRRYGWLCESTHSSRPIPVPVRRRPRR